MFHELYGLPTVSLRYFNVFGPRQVFDSPYSGVIGKFCTGLLAGQAPTIFSDGLQSRDFVDVANVVAANLLAAEQPAERVAGRVFNIGGGASVNLLQLLAELNRLTGQNVAPAFAPARPGGRSVLQSQHFGRPRRPRLHGAGLLARGFAADAGFLPSMNGGRRGRVARACASGPAAP